MPDGDNNTPVVVVVHIGTLAVGPRDKLPAVAQRAGTLAAAAAAAAHIDSQGAEAALRQVCPRVAVALVAQLRIARTEEARSQA